MNKVKCELYHDNFQNFKRFNIKKAQLVIADIPCNIGDTVYLLRNGFIEPCNVEGIHFTSRKSYVRLRPFQQA